MRSCFAFWRFQLAMALWGMASTRSQSPCQLLYLYRSSWLISSPVGDRKEARLLKPPAVFRAKNPKQEVFMQIGLIAHKVLVWSLLGLLISVVCCLAFIAVR
jgi:hypothetical protein